jgi:hypothetical protein
MFYFSVESQFSLAQIPIRLCQIIKFLPGFLGKIARITQIHQNPSKSIKIHQNPPIFSSSPWRGFHAASPASGRSTAWRPR